MIFQATLAFSEPNKKRRKQSIKTWKFVLKPPFLSEEHVDMFDYHLRETPF